MSETWPTREEIARVVDHFAFVDSVTNFFTGETRSFTGEEMADKTRDAFAKADAILALFPPAAPHLSKGEWGRSVSQEMVDLRETLESMEVSEFYGAQDLVRDAMSSLERLERLMIQAAPPPPSPELRKD